MGNNPFRLLKTITRELQIRIWDRIAQTRKLNQLQIRPIRDQGFPTVVFPVQYITGNKTKFSDRVGLYSLRDVYLHRYSGLCLVLGHPSDRSIGIRESGMDDYTELFLRSHIVKKINQVDRAACDVESFPLPAYVFNVFQKKSNYWHFLVDNLSRLIFLLFSIQTPIVVLHFCTREGFIGQYFDLLEKAFDCTFHPIQPTGSGHIHIKSSVLFLEETFRRNNCSASFYHQNLSRLSDDHQLTLLSLDRSDLYETHKTNRHGLTRRFDHMLDKSSRHRKSGATYKNTAPWHSHSETSIQSVFKFGELIVRDHNAISNQQTHLLICRDPLTSGKRFLKTQNEILAAFPSILPIDFASKSVEEQIILSYNCGILVGVIGAGLSNAIFMKPKSLVIEIAPLGYSIPATTFVEDLCANRNLIYERIYSTPIDHDLSTSLDPYKLKGVLSSYSTAFDRT
jgi:hypothetical protein